MSAAVRSAGRRGGWPDLPVADRLTARMTVAPSGCWMIDGASRNGYGKIWVDGHGEYAHRMAYLAWVGPIPEGFEIDHQCHNADPTCPAGSKCEHRRCINPEHLDAVPHRTNMLRGKTPSGDNYRKDSCDRGHPFSGANLKLRKGRNGQTWRRCLECVRIYEAGR